MLLITYLTCVLVSIRNLEAGRRESSLCAAATELELHHPSNTPNHAAQPAAPFLGQPRVCMD